MTKMKVPHRKWGLAVNAKLAEIRQIEAMLRRHTRAIRWLKKHNPKLLEPGWDKEAK